MDPSERRIARQLYVAIRLNVFSLEILMKMLMTDDNLQAREVASITTHGHMYTLAN